MIGHGRQRGARSVVEIWLSFALETSVARSVRIDLSGISADTRKETPRTFQEGKTAMGTRTKKALERVPNL